jgi:thiamine-monophosphate kinase
MYGGSKRRAPYNRAVKVSEIGEFGLIKLLAREFGIEYPPKPGHVASGLLVGLGDDAVVTERRDGAVIWTTDTMVEGNHFTPGLGTWEDAGWKALASNASDIAAMGGKPYLALVTLMLSADFCVDDAVALYRGLHECAEAFEVTLGGGDIVRSPTFAITIALAGWAHTSDTGQPVVLRRDTARPGDLVAVTGAPGESAGGLKLLLAGRTPTSEHEKRLVAAHVRPQPRVELGQAAVQAGLRCGIDVSDGLLQDLGHIATASAVGFVVDATKVPVSDALRVVWPDDALNLTLGGGEDYELVVVGPRDAMERYVAAADNGVTVIGEVVAAADKPIVRVLDAEGRDMVLANRGWDHFATA